MSNIAIRSLFAAVSIWLSTGPIDADGNFTSRQAMRLNHHPVAVRQNEPQVYTIEPGKQIERDLAGGESHTYLVTLASGQYLQGVIAQRHMDLTATLLGPDGRQVELFDSRWYGPEPIYFVAEVSGSYRLAIQPLNRTAARGSYQLTVEALRPPTPQDQKRVAALKSSAEGKRLIGQGGERPYKQAKEKYEEALPRWREIGDRFAEAQTLHSLGFVFGQLGAPPKALEYYNQALPIRQEINDRDGEGETLHGIAHMNSALGRKEQALDYYNRALTIRRAGANRAAEATTLGNICQINFSLGNLRRAIECYQQSLPLWRDAGRRDGEASAFIGLGSIHVLIGESQKAQDYLYQALAISRGINDRRGKASALFNLGKIHAELGEREKAFDALSQALTLFRAVSDRNGEAMALNNLGSLEALSEAKEKAADFFNQALAIWRGMNDRYGEAYALLHLGRLHGASDEKQKALDYYNQALALFQKAKHPRGEALTLNDLGLLYADSDERQKALDFYHRALPHWREMGDRISEATTLANLARAESDLGNLTESRRRIENSLAIMETMRVKIAGRRLRDSYFATTQRHHEFYIDLLMRLHRLQPSAGHNVSALQANERARARGLLDMLAEARGDINHGIDATLLERERSLQKQINDSAEYQYRLLNEKHTREQMEAVKLELDSRIDELRLVEAEIRKTSPRYAELKYPQPLNLAEIQQMLDSNTMLLEYSLGEERSYLWAVTPTTIESFELPKRAEIEAVGRQAYGLLAAGETAAQLQARLAGSVTKSPEWAADLSRILLGPVAASLGKKRLVIVADGALQYLPFAALPEPETGGRGDKGTRGQGNKGRGKARNPRVPIRNPLIADHEIVSLPSASSLAVLRHEFASRVPAPKIVAVIADPVFNVDDERFKKRAQDPAILNNQQTTRSGDELDVFRSAREVGTVDSQQRLQRLYFSRREAEAIMSLAPGATGLKAVDFAASRATTLDPNLSQYRIIHFATHGLLNSQYPELSGIVLSLFDEQGRPQDGFLRLHDIYNLKLAADLVVLSACKTGLGKEVKGEGLVGLTRGFLYAGAPRVVASLWKVDDRATAELMKQFYQRMLGAGLRPAAALREAQIAMWRQKRWAAPYYWAGFALQGEWK